MRGAGKTSKWPLAALVLPLIQGCGSSLSGDVRDAASDRPIAGASVIIVDAGFGTRDGSLVKDKERRFTAITDTAGVFRIDGTSGGVRLLASAPGYADVETSLCSRSPMTVRMGGPYESPDGVTMLRVDTRPGRKVAGWRFGARFGIVPNSNADLILVQAPPDSGPPMAGLRAPAGMVFRAGTGNPPALPAAGYTESLSLDLFKCGWLFVKTSGGGIAAVKIGTFGFDEPLDGGRYLTLPYVEPPVRRPQA